MTAPTTTDSSVLHQDVLGGRRLSNYFWAVVLSVGATGFFLAGLSSYSGVNLLPFSDPTHLVFIPQGIAMGFYGFVGLSLGGYLWLIVLWNVGGGYNEFNRDRQEVQIVRSGFPGKNRRVELTYPFDAVLAVRIEIKEGLNPKRALYLRIKGKGDIPLTRVGRPLSLSEIENQGAELARFLGVPLEGL